MKVPFLYERILHFPWTWWKNIPTIIYWSLNRILKPSKLNQLNYCFKNRQTNCSFKRATVTAAIPFSAFSTRAFAGHTAGSTSLCQHFGSSRPSQSKFFLLGSPYGSDVSPTVHCSAAAHLDCSRLDFNPSSCHPSALSWQPAPLDTHFPLAPAGLQP